MTWYERTLAYFKAHNFQEVPSRSKKYRMFELSVEGKETRTYLLGDHGAVRRELRYKVEGRNKKLTVSVTELFRERVVLWERKSARGKGE